MVLRPHLPSNHPVYFVHLYYLKNSYCWALHGNLVAKALTLHIQDPI